MNAIDPSSNPLFPTTLRRNVTWRGVQVNVPLTPRSPFDACFFQGDCREFMTDVAAAHPEGVFQMIFADPPYRVSSGSVTCKSGQIASVYKAEWDRSKGYQQDHAWNQSWLVLARRLLTANGTIWVSGIHRNIFSVGHIMAEIGMRILSLITWVKPSPPPCITGRYFTFETEQLVWAAKSKDSRHTFNERMMRHLAGGQAMGNVWTIAPPGPDEKRFGRHPTQKPVELIRRAILSCTAEGDRIFDPFVGSGTTTVAAIETGRDCVGLDLDAAYLATAVRRSEAAIRARCHRLPSR